MSRNRHLWSQQLVVATALAVGASGSAVSDDSSMRRFGGDSYAYFANQPAVSAPSAWRQTHPTGLTERELQALSSSDLSTFASQVNPPVFASAPTDPMWRQTHPNGLTERELMALSSSSLSRWQVPDGTTPMMTQSNIAQSLDKETLATRLTNFFHVEK